MTNDPAIQRINATCDRIIAMLDHMHAQHEHMQALILAILGRLGRRDQDVPLHQRGFGVMDEPPA
jgi:hypothetical protein